MWEALTLVGVLCGSVGFIAQFVGLRGLPWPCSISQLGGIFIMALVRALVRRRMGRVPPSCQALPDHELDFLSTKIVFDESFRECDDTLASKGSGLNDDPSKVCSWRIMTAKLDGDKRFPLPSLKPEEKIRPPEGPSLTEAPSTLMAENPNQHLVLVRERLGNLCKWTNSASEPATALGQAIERFMKEFLPRTSTLDHGNDSIDSFSWVVETRKSAETGSLETGHISLSVRRSKDEKVGWLVNIGELEAVLSLWISGIEAEVADKSEPTLKYNSGSEVSDWRRSKLGVRSKLEFCRIIGENFEDGILKRDISWWVGGATEEANKPENRGGKKARLVIGFSGPPQGR